MKTVFEGDHQEWFESWFDSHYYHVLYQHRNDDEAAEFIKKLVDFINLSTSSKVLDLACGKGRHAWQLSKFGFKVEGADLSVNNIKIASQLAHEKLIFFKHDMRDAFPKDKQYQAIFNLFTSFGYFDDLTENEKVIQHVFNALSANGLFILDFFNSHKLVNQIIPFEKKELEGISFEIEREITPTHIIKKIKLKEQGKSCVFEEKVQLLNMDYFMNLFERNNFKIKQVFGDYELNPFQKESSDRLIIIAQK
jgi:SAM-dependent methyltransferase